ncbi:MAG: polyprenyl synthetase family protein [Legionellaceae bacterium]
MTIHSIRALVHDDMEAVNALIIEHIQSDISLLSDLSHHIIQSGGKRLRPLLVLLASRACGYEGRDHIKLATMVEFFHTATLLHDDVIDESSLRRGRETAHTIWGSKASILVGDYLFTQYIQLMIEMGNLEIMQHLTKMTHDIGCGEIKQLNYRNNPALSEEDYFDIIRSKTSILFATSARVSALLSHASTPVQEALENYGLHLGNAFQLIDDALDYCSDAQTLGKNVGDDLADGKMTLPLIHVLKEGSAQQQASVIHALKQGSLEGLPDILEAIEATGAIDYTKKMALASSQKAIASLALLPPSTYQKGLIDLAHYAVARAH